MSNNLVPKVIITEAVQQLAVPQGNQVVIGIIWTSASWTANTIYNISSVSEADALFGSNYINGAYLVPMIRKAFAEWASSIKAVSCWQPTLPAASNTLLTANATAWALTVTVASWTAFTSTKVVYLWTGQTYAKEERLVVASSTSTSITFTTAIQFDHYIGEQCQIVTPKVSTDYTSAITALLPDESKSIAICETNDTATAALMKTMCIDSKDKYNTPCEYIRSCEAADDEAAIKAKWVAHNSDRVILCYPLLVEFNGRVTSPWENAAALAWVIAWNGVPKLNHNFSTFETFGWVAKGLTDVDGLISSWVTPIELKYSSIHLVRLLTTYVTLNGVPDKVWQEWAVRLNVDYMEKTIASLLQSKFLQQGNTPQVRLAMWAEVETALKKFVAMDIIVPDLTTNTPAYRAPVVSVDPSDATKVNVDVQIAPGKPLNFINLNFKVYL